MWFPIYDGFEDELEIGMKLSPSANIILIYILLLLDLSFIWLCFKLANSSVEYYKSNAQKTQCELASWKRHASPAG